MQKTFILGVGSQKGGTTWLHRQLTSNATVDLGHKKEYHVFDSIELQEQTRDKKANLKHGWRDRCINKVIKAHHQNQLGKNLSSKNVIGDSKHGLAYLPQTAKDAIGFFK